MKRLIATLVLAALGGVAHADVTTNVGVTSDYRFRGISQSQNSMALQGGVDYTHKSGFYAGNRNSTVSSAVYGDSTGLEMDLYGGYRYEIVKGIKLDVGSYNYVYGQSGRKFNSAANTHEVYVGLQQGPVTLRYNRAISDYFGLANSSGTQYVQAEVAVPVAKGFTANAHLGRTMVANRTGLDYTDAKFGVTTDVQGFQVGAHYVTNLGISTVMKAASTVGGQRLHKDTVLFTVSRQF